MYPPVGARRRLLLPRLLLLVAALAFPRLAAAQSDDLTLVEFQEYGVGILLPPGEIESIDLQPCQLDFETLLQWEPLEPDVPCARLKLSVDVTATKDMEAQRALMEEVVALLDKPDEQRTLREPQLGGRTWHQLDAKFTQQPGRFGALTVLCLLHGWREYTLSFYFESHEQQAQAEPFMHGIASALQLADPSNPDAMRWTLYAPPGSGVRLLLPTVGTYRDASWNSDWAEEWDFGRLSSVFTWVRNRLPLTAVHGYWIDGTEYEVDDDGFLAFSEQLRVDFGEDMEALSSTELGYYGDYDWKLYFSAYTSEYETDGPLERRIEVFATTPHNDGHLVINGTWRPQDGTAARGLFNAVLEGTALSEVPEDFYQSRVKLTFPEYGLGLELPEGGFLQPVAADVGALLGGEMTEAWYSLASPLYLFFGMTDRLDTDELESEVEIEWAMREVFKRFAAGGLTQGGVDIPLLEELPIVKTELATWYGGVFDLGAAGRPGLRVAFYMAYTGGHSRYVCFAFKASETEEARAAIQAVLPTIVPLDPVVAPVDGALLAALPPQRR